MKTIQLRHTLHLLFVISLAILLSACGGGGGSGPTQGSQNTINSGGSAGNLGNCNTTPGSQGTCGNTPGNNTGGGGAVQTSITIDTSNAAEITNAVIGTIDVFYNLGERQGIGSSIITATQNTPATGSFSLADFAFQQLAYMAELDSLSLLNTPMVVGVNNAQLVPCSSGDVDSTITNPNTANPAFDATFTNCVFAGTTLNGSLGMTDVSINGNVNTIGAAWDMSALFTFTGGLTINDGTNTYVINAGTVRFSASADNNAIGSGTIQVVIPLGISIGSQTDTIQSDFILAYDFDPSTATEITVNGTLNRSSSASSALTIVTQTPLKRFSGVGVIVNNLPPGPYNAGVLRIISGGGSNVTLTIIDSTTIELNLNDGAATTNMNWEDLLIS